MDRNRLTAAGFTLGWLLLSWHWILSDSLIRDGDEEGHVGAAELFRDLRLESGWGLWLWEAWQGSYGEYPPLFAAVLGAWWSLYDVPPEHFAIRGILPFSVLVSAVCVARMSWRTHDRWLLSFVFVLSLPLANGVARHFMLEPMMMALSCASLMALLETKEEADWRWALLGGVSIGLGLLCKQTIVLIAGLPLIALWIRCTTRDKAIVSGVSGMIALPWYLKHSAEQSVYLSSSASSSVNATVLGTILYYPLGAILLGFGIVGSLLILWGIYTQRKQDSWIWLWAIGGLAILILMPKKYPRLMLAWLPVGGIVVAHLKKEKVLAALLVLQLAIQSHLSSVAIPLQQDVDERCPQVWLRPPSSLDLHLKTIGDLVKTAPPGYIAIRNNPSIPCSIQSTHDWAYHLDPYLRRRNIHRQILLSAEDSDWTNAAIQIKWVIDKPVDDPSAIDIAIQEK